jgi:opacity protein-like surface antigen
MRRSAICGVVGVLMGVAGAAQAEGGAAVDETVRAAVLAAQQPQKEQEAFSKGSWAVEVWGSYIDSNAVSSEEVSGGSGNVGVGYYLLDRLGVYAEVAGYGLSEDHQDDADAAGGGFNLLLRWHFLKIDKLTFYVDGAAGLVEFGSDFPSGGTRFNFVERVGLGATYQLADHMHLMGGVRYLHLSNADIDGSDRNPAFDALEYYAGLMFTF